MSAFVARALKRDLVFVILIFLRSSGGSCNAPGSWRGWFSDLGPASHEFNKLPPHLSAVLLCSLEEQLWEIPSQGTEYFLPFHWTSFKGKNKTKKPTTRISPEVVSVSCLSLSALGWYARLPAGMVQTKGCGGRHLDKKQPWFFPACVIPADVSSHCCWECVFLCLGVAVWFGF